MRKLTLDDIADLRAYERERDELRARIIATKKRRRVQLGELMTIVFENTDTMRYQIQEMARVERLMTDGQIQHELDTYNGLIPDDDELSGTLFIELTSDELLREWLPKLVGIQRTVGLRLPDGTLVHGHPEDEERLTREDITSSVHTLKFRFTPDEALALRGAGTALVVTHPEYTVVAELSDETRVELAADLGL